jgi:hypothetical protein
MKSASFAIYKGTGALKISKFPVKRNDKGWVERNGAIYFEVAPSSGYKQWDWTKKIVFAAGVQDICNLLDSNLQANDKKRKCFHDQSKNPTSDSTAVKTLEFVPGSADFPGTYMLKVSEKNPDGAWNSVTVPVSDGEFKVIRGLMTGSVASLLGWE